MTLAAGVGFGLHLSRETLQNCTNAPILNPFIRRAAYGKYLCMPLV